MPITFLPHDLTVKSTNGNGVSHTLVNNSEKILVVHWIDYNGEFRLSGTVAPTKEWSSSTSDTHPKAVESIDGSIKFIFMGAGTVVVPSSGNPYEKLSNSEEFLLFGNWSTHWGYGIPDLVKALDLNTSSNEQALSEGGQNNNKALNLFNALMAWNAGYTGKGVKVAVLDEGIPNHQEISPIIRKDIVEGDDDTSPVDTSARYHGISVAAVIGASRDSNQDSPDITGIAPDAEILDIRIAKQGSNDENISEGIRFAVDSGAKVIQISQGSDNTWVSETVLAAIQYAVASNVLVVFAGGNGASNQPLGFPLLGFHAPIVSVGNFNLDTMRPFSSSNLGGTNPFPYFFAPSGGYYPEEGKSYYFTSDGGTSFASPYITGVAALIFQKYPTIGINALIDKLIEASWIPSLGKEAEIDERNINIITWSGENSITGSNFIDQVIIEEKSDSFSLITNEEGNLIYSTDENQTFLLSGVERIKFSDIAIATNQDDRVVDALEILFAYTGSSFLLNPADIGLAIAIMDKYSSRDDVLRYVQDEIFGFKEDLMPSIEVALENVYGIQPSNEIRQLVRDIIEAKSFTMEQFFWSIAESNSANDQIELIGQYNGYITYIETDLFL